MSGEAWVWLGCLFLLLLWLAWIWVPVLRARFRKPTSSPLEYTEPKRKPDTELARHVWAAHVAAQEHDLAVLTGEPEELQSTLQLVISTNNELERYLLSRRKEKDSDVSK